MSYRFEQLRDDSALRERLTQRAKIIAAVRKWFRDEGFLEVETPTLVRTPGMEPHLSTFETVLKEQGSVASHAVHLITSPEYAMKKLLAAGFPKIFELARCYRNDEPWDGGHNPEFTMLEWYRADADYRSIMDDVEAMVSAVAKEANGTTLITVDGTTVDLAPSWERMTVTEAFRTYANMDLNAVVDDAEAFAKAARGAGHEIPENMTFEDAFFKVFLTAIEPSFGRTRPTILYDWPASMAALSRLKPEDPRYAERFEVYVRGVELANAFSELNDADEQRRRLLEEQGQRRTMGKPDFPLDEEFLSAVGSMPPSGGIALGVDRLVMLLTSASTIRDVLAFPATMIFGKDR
jgi:lysyl-tRNA synthetase class 2